MPSEPPLEEEPGAPGPRGRRSFGKGCLAGCLTGCLGQIVVAVASIGLAVAGLYYFGPEIGLDALSLPDGKDGSVTSPDAAGDALPAKVERALAATVGELVHAREVQAAKDSLEDDQEGFLYAARDAPTQEEINAAVAQDALAKERGEEVPPRTWAWEDRQGQIHMTTTRPPKGAKVLSMGRPGEGKAPTRTGIEPRRPDEPAKPRKELPQLKSPTELARLLLDEINRLRANPSAYARELEEIRDTFAADVYRSASGRLIETKEGTTAFDEAITDLKATGSLPLVARSKAATLAARAHARYLGKTGRQGHRGRKGSRPLDRVLRFHKPNLTSVGEVISYGAQSPREIVHGFVVDDGVADRGHRNALLDPTFAKAGAACAKHALNPVCVVDLIEP